MKTLKEIATGLSVPETTLRLYRDEFEEYIPASGEGRRRRYSDMAGERLGQIVAWKREGWTAPMIRDALAETIKPEAKARRRNTDERLDELSARLAAQQGELAALRAEVGGLRADLKRLIDLLERPPLAFEDALAVPEG